MLNVVLYLSPFNFSGTVILSLTSSDADSGLNADIKYYIVSGDPLGQFQFHTTNELFVNRPLDRESQGHYRLNVAATDGAHVTYTTVNVNVLDDNDNSPECAEVKIDFVFYLFILPLYFFVL